MSSNTQLPPSITTPPPPVPNTIVSFPRPHVLLVTLNRPKQLNAIPRPQHFALERLWDWFDAQPALRVAVFTGAGRAFCAGADLKEWHGINSSGPESPSPSPSSAAGNQGTNRRFPPGGFGGMSNRGGLKPIIGAVNGICFGGGMEMAINCDLVVAAADAQFALPEVTIGVIALAGALPRLVRSVGRQRAAEMALSGKKYGAKEMLAWGLVNEVVEGDGKVLEVALAWAERIAGNSPDAVIVSREGLKLGWEGLGPEQGTDLLLKGWFGRMEKGENAVEGVSSFVERRKPVWKDSKL
ncbi:enoyl-CoA hydratase/carnithine racemase [Annulohypoxylon bovei var. microspora]|nr:enoyl-CoA hydratase/carnithine racemase [Annulohypoxylon bovei var. microspora]